MSDPSMLKNAQTRQDSPSHMPARETDLLATRPWLRHYESGVPAQLSIPDVSLTWLLDTAARRYPSRSALIYYGTKISYAQLVSWTKHFAMELLRLGVQRGDRIAIALPNIPQYLIAFYGALRAGAVVVPTNPLYTEREMQHQLTDAGAKVLVMLDTYYPLVRRIRQRTALAHVIVTGVTDYLPPVLRILFPLSQIHADHPTPALTTKELQADTTLSSMHTLLQSYTRKSATHFDLPEPADSSDLAVLQYTGGTTGLSKGAMLTHGNLLANAFQTRYWTPQVHDGEETTLCVAPFFHAYGLTVGMNLSLLTGATMILLPRFQVKDVVNAIRRYHPTLFPGIPTMYIAILRATGKQTAYLKSIRICISGAAPLPARVQADFEAATHGRLVEGYGLSEAAPVTHCNPLTGDYRHGSIGLPLPNVTAAILDQETGEPAPAGTIGEIVVKGPNVMQGYWQRKEETRAVLYDGWLHTGDLGKVDADGFFYVVERAKDMILASGFNVYPREVEEVLFRHPFVSEAAVVGTPDEYRGETVTAFVVLAAGVSACEETRQDILAFCRQELTAYKVPKKLEFRTSLPKSLIGKVLRRELRHS